MPSPQGKSGHSQHPEKPFSRQHVRWRHKQESSASVLSRQPLQDGLPHRAQTSTAILALQIKRLISVDFALPLKGFDYAGYEPWPIHGSMALTAAGQEALDSLDIQGCGA